MADDSPDTTATRYEWERVIRRARLGAPCKAVALAMATYADRDGSRVYPGVTRLAAVTELSERSVYAALKKLRTLGFVDCLSRGGHRGEQGLASVYRLTIPVDLFDVVEMLQPGEMPAPQPAPDSGWESPQPAPGSSQPAPGAVQPAPDDAQPAPGAPHQFSTNHTPTQLPTDGSSFGTEVQNAREDFGGNVVTLNVGGRRR